MRKKLSPSDGGCFLCSTEIPHGVEFRFSGEFDANVEPDCVTSALAKDPSHPEARIIAREFDMPVPPDPLDELV